MHTTNSSQSIQLGLNAFSKIYRYTMMESQTFWFHI